MDHGELGSTGRTVLNGIAGGLGASATASNGNAGTWNLEGATQKALFGVRAGLDR